MSNPRFFCLYARGGGLNFSGFFRGREEGRDGGLLFYVIEAIDTIADSYDDYSCL